MYGHQSLQLSIWPDLSLWSWWCSWFPAEVLSLGVSMRCSFVEVGGCYVLGMIVWLIVFMGLHVM